MNNADHFFDDMQGQSGTCLAQLQSYLDEFAQLQIDRRINDWVQTDVANLVDDIGIVRYEIDEVSHESLLFLEKSIIHIRPDNKQISHYPKNLLHCFIEDKRDNPEKDHVFRVELFSITPAEEQLCWIRQSKEINEISELQITAASWLKWLNS